MSLYLASLSATNPTNDTYITQHDTTRHDGCHHFLSNNKQVMKREREASQAVGKDYAARPVSYKGSLSLKLDRYTQRRKSRSRSPERPRGSGGGGGRGTRDDRRAEPSPPRRKAAPVITAEELRRQEELKKRYGDASASKR